MAGAIAHGKCVYSIRRSPEYRRRTLRTLQPASIAQESAGAVFPFAATGSPPRELV